VKVVPLKYNGSARRYISNADNAQINIDINNYIGHSMMLLYTKNSVNRKDIMHVIPTDAYNNSHTSINPADFTGSVMLYDYTGTIFRGGWKYSNGTILGRISTYNIAASPSDDCVKKTIILEKRDNGTSSLSGATTNYGPGSTPIDIINGSRPGDHITIGGAEYIYKGYGTTPCCVNCVPLGTSQGNDPPSTNGESPANNEIIKGGPTSQPTTQFGELVCVQVAQLLACAEKNTPQSIINRNPNDSPDTQAAKFEESKKRFTLYVKLIEQALKDHPVLKPYASQINFPTNQATLDILAGSYGNAINDQQSYESVGCALTSGFGTATLPPAQKEILEDDLGKVCNQINEAYKALVPLIEDCNNANGVVNDILSGLQAQNLNPVNVFKYGKYAEEGDITKLWDSLKGSQTPVSTNNPDNPAEVMLLRSDGVKMRYSPTNGAIFSYLKFTKDECENRINDITKLVNESINKLKDKGLFRNLTSVGTFQDVNLYVDEDLEYGAAYTLPGIGIHVSRREYNEFTSNDLIKKQNAYNTLKHEYGHILQAKIYGKMAFYTTIAPYSILSAEFATKHQCSWTETDANKLASHYFCNQKNDCNWNNNDFPLNCN
jgi:hypothetical protein